MVVETNRKILAYDETLSSTDNFFEQLFGEKAVVQRRCRGIGETLLVQLIMMAIVTDDDCDLAAERVLKFFGMGFFQRVRNPSEKFLEDVANSLAILRDNYAEEIRALYSESPEHSVLGYTKVLLCRIMPDRHLGDDDPELSKVTLDELEDVPRRVSEALFRAARDDSRDLNLLDETLGKISVKKLTHYSADYLMAHVRNFGQGAADDMEKALAKRGWHLLGGGALTVNQIGRGLVPDGAVLLPPYNRSPKRRAF